MLHSLRFVIRTLDDGKEVKILQQGTERIVLSEDGEIMGEEIVWQDVPLVTLTQE